MKRNFIILLISIALFGIVSGQSDSSSVYKNLETKKFYSLSYHSMTRDGKSTYEINGKKVSESTYNKYHSTWENMENCTPCFLEYYNQEDVLLRQAVVYQDCGVGDFKKYYPDGKTIEVSGSYTENPTGNWENIFYRGYCSTENGQWVYYDKKGDTLYSEFWNNGNFIKQVPEQLTNEIWKIELTLDGEPVQGKSITSEQVKQLVLTPKFKNTTASKTKLTVNLQATAISYRQGEKTFAPDEFDEVNIQAILKEAGIPKSKKPSYTVMIYNEDAMVAHFEFEVK